MKNLNKHNKNIQTFLTKQLKEHTEPQQAKVLEIGIGKGRIGKLLAKEVKKYKGIDIIEKNVKKARENKPEQAKIEYKQGNAVDVPFEEKFDVILYVNSWHFIKDSDQAISEAEKLIKENGVVIIIEPTEYTTNWHSSKLKKNSEQFDEEIYNQKMQNIKDSEENLRKQDKFKIKEEGFIDKKNSRCYILKT
jgi:2-polyprenyl-3-methyl-5-hydroxy-6-metoxy-1,4-benzoquinol methylase